MLAAEFDNHKSFEYLLKAGANLNIKNKGAEDLCNSKEDKSNHKENIRKQIQSYLKNL